MGSSPGPSPGFRRPVNVDGVGECPLSPNLELKYSSSLHREYKDQVALVYVSKTCDFVTSEVDGYSPTKRE